MVTAQNRRLLFRRRMTTDRFISELKAVSPGNVRLLQIPYPTDTTTNALKPDGRVHTNSATIQGRITRQGNGILVSYNGTDQYATTPDTADQSFGDGSVDSAFSVFAFANVTDTAGERDFISRWEAAKHEWLFKVDSTDKMQLLLYDESAAKAPLRTSAAITQGVPTLYSGTYDPALGSGDTAATGITLYQNGAVITSSPTQAVGYIAMENTTTVTQIGRQVSGEYFSGSLGFVAVYAAALTTPQHRRIRDLCREYYLAVL